MHTTPQMSPPLMHTRRPRPIALLAALLIAGLVLNLGFLQVALAAGADNLGSATVIAPPLANDATDTTGATRDAGEIGGGPAGNTCNFPLSGNTHSVWYKYTAASNGWLQLDTFGSGYDTVLEVFSGPASPTFATLTSIACNDDSAGTRQSALTAPVASGTSYYIVVRSYGGGPGGSLDFSAAFSAQLNLYVNQTTGNDNNPGTAALPVKTIQRAVNLAPASGTSVINVVSPGVYDESVTIGKNLTLAVPSGAVTANAFTLASGAVVALAGAGTISAPTVNVQPGAVIQQGISLVSVGGAVNLAPGTYTQNVTISKSLTLQGASAPPPVIDPSSGDAITISSGTATITGLTIQGAITGINVTGGAGHTVYRNNITTNTSGVVNATGTPVDAAENFWGNATGPTHATNPGGTGDSVSNNVAYRPWCTTPVPGCLPRAGASTRLVFTTSPGNTPAGVAFATQPVVQAQDDLGNLDTTFNGAVTLAIKTGTGTVGATLGGTVTVNAVNGVADFAGQGVKINYVGQSYQLTATSGALNSSSSGDSAPFDITADRLVFSTSPGNTPAGVPFAAQPVVAAGDAFGHVDTTFAGNITLAIKAGTGTAGATLAPLANLTVTAANGVASFSGLNIDKVGTAYQLTASTTGLTGADSAAFDITAGTATQLVFSASPSNSTAGVAFPTQPVVQALDAVGNLATGFNGAVTLVIKAGTGTAGAVLGGTVTVNAVNGVATFSGLRINLVGTAYQLTASATGLTSADSTAFDITAGAATQLVFSTSPSDSVAGVAFPTQPVVQALDAGGNLATGFSGAVTVAIKGGTGTAGATLGGTVTVNAVNGVATFSGLNIDKAGTAYRLTAASTGLTGADSNTFNITAGAATQLAFTTSPGSTPAGVAFAAQPVVQARDAFGNLDTTFTGAVTIAIKPGTGTAGAVLGGTLTVNAVGGVATFSGLNIDRIGTAYQLTASAAGLTGADSNAFNITADRLVFTTSPSNSVASTAFPTQPVVQAVDSFGTLDSNFGGAVTLAIKSGTGTAGATLAGTLTVNAVGGVATFSGLNIDKVGTAYQLTAASGALNSTATGDSAAFDITAGAASKLVFSTSPSDSVAGVAFATQPVVQALDAGGNLATSFSGAVTLAIKGGTGTAGATLAGTVTVSAVNGVATFSGLSIDKAGTAYRLTAASTGLTGADSNTFNITAGAAASLVFSTSPSDAMAAASFPTQPVVQALDAFGNLATTYNGMVTLAIKGGTGTAGATLGGTLALNAVNGVATFSGLSIDKVGAAYQLTASAAGLTGANSNAFNITATGLVFTVQPVNSTAGQVFAVKVAAEDLAGNIDTTFGGAVTLAIKSGTGTAGATLGGTLTINAVNGVADFTGKGLNIDKIGTGYQLMASNGRNLAPAVSTSFNISAGPAASLVFSTSPSNSPAGVAFPTQPVVEAHDALGNLASSFNGSVALTIKSGTGTAGATLGGTTTVNAVGGVATFSGLSIDKAGQAYRLTAAAAGVTSGDSAAFNVGASRLVFSVSPSDASVGRAFPTQPVVRAEDSTGALDTSFNGPVTLAIKAGTGTAGATLGGTVTVNAVAGVATFSGLSIDRVGTGYRLAASSGTLAVPDSGAFNILISRVYLPALMNSPKPDLVGSFTLSPDSVAPNSPVTITVTITNRGTAPASQFWVDFYINPSTPPTDTNQPWNRRCGMTPCYGIAWYVPGIIEPGQSITLRSTADSYFAANTRWRGAFAMGTSDLYLYVDSWNPTVATGAVDELDETNNRAEYHAQPTGAAPSNSFDTDSRSGDLWREELPPRPVRP